MIFTVQDSKPASPVTEANDDKAAVEVGDEVVVRFPSTAAGAIEVKLCGLAIRSYLLPDASRDNESLPVEYMIMSYAEEGK
jgi:hypothetical protein